MQNEPHAHAHHRIAEAVVKSWPSYEVSEADVAEVIEKHNNLTDDSAAIAIAMQRRLPVMAIEAVIAEAGEYGLLELAA